MRIDWLDMEGFGAASGRFRFPQSGLGIWAAPNGGGKSSLTRAISTALYGAESADDDPEAAPTNAWVALRLRLDDGTPLVIRRELNEGLPHVTDASGRDVTAQYRDEATGTEPGEKITGLTRAQFEESAFLRFEDLADTVGNRTFRSLFARGRGPAERSRTVDSQQPGAPEPGTSQDVAILHTAAEETSWSESGILPGPSREELDEAAARARAAAGTELPLERVRRLRTGIDLLDQRLAERMADLEDLSSQLADSQAESGRLEALTGAEQEDAERLQKLVALAKRLQQKRETLRIDEDQYRRSLEERGLSAEAIQERDAVFQELPDDDLAFLDGYRERETVLRGTQAVTRSEARLDEAQLTEIARLRSRGTRLAMAPLAVATVGLFGSIATRLLPAPPSAPLALMAMGLVAATAGSYLLWRARTWREKERVELAEALERKHEQMENIDRDAKQFVGRLGAIAQSCRLPSPTDALKHYADWVATRAEWDQLDRFRLRAEEIQLETAAVREKLGSFISGDSSSLDMNDSHLEDLESIYQDYVRFFELRRQQEEIETRRTAIEDDLAAIENEKADLRERIFEVLEGAGVESDRELDEAIEVFALRQDHGSSDSWAIPGVEIDPQWIAGLSARMEAIVRCFLPEARNVEIDGNLSPSLRFDSKAPAIPYRELKEQVSPSTIDLVCLALRLSVVETLSSSGERIPVILDDPLVRTDDIRHDRALDFLVTDASERNQIVLLTAQEVKARWFLHQFPKHRERVTPIHGASPASASASSSSQSVRSAS